MNAYATSSFRVPAARMLPAVRMLPRAFVLPLALALPMSFVLPVAAVAQVMAHPTELRLSEPRAPRPEPERFRVELPGGAVAYVVEDGTVPLVTLSAFIGSGTADGPPGAAAALAAALRARGPADMELGAFHAALRRMAADLRIASGAEEFEITLDVPAEDAVEAAELLSALLRRPALAGADPGALLAGTVRRSPSEAATGESGPVPYEGSLDVAIALLHDHLLGETPYARAPTAAQARALTAEDLQRFHRDHFVGGNITLAVSGRMDRRALLDRLRADLADLPSGRRPAPARARAPRPAERRNIHLYNADKLTGWVVMGHALDPVPPEDEPALRVMNYILGGGHFDTRLFVEVRDKRGLANTAGGHPEPGLRGPGIYTLRTYGRPEAIPLLVHILEREARRIRTELVTDEELRVAKGALAHGEFAMEFHDGAATARSFARERLRDGTHRRSEAFQARVAAVTAEDVRRAAREYLHPDGFQMVILGPLDAIAAAPRLEDEPPLDAFGTVRRER